MKLHVRELHEACAPTSTVSLLYARTGTSMPRRKMEARARRSLKNPRHTRVTSLLCLFVCIVAPAFYCLLFKVVLRSVYARSCCPLSEDLSSTTIRAFLCHIYLNGLTKPSTNARVMSQNHHSSPERRLSRAEYDGIGEGWLVVSPLGKVREDTAAHHPRHRGYYPQTYAYLFGCEFTQTSQSENGWHPCG